METTTNEPSISSRGFSEPHGTGVQRSILQRVDIYLDDIIVFGRNFEEHMEN